MPVHPDAPTVLGEQGTPRWPTCPSRRRRRRVPPLGGAPATSPTRPWRSAREGVWFQLGVVDDDAFGRTTEAGVPMVMDTCPAIEWPRLAAVGADGRAADPPRRHRRHAARAARSPTPTAGWRTRTRRDPRLGRGAEPAHPRAPGRAASPRVVPPHDDRRRRPPARRGPPDKVGDRYVVSRNDGSQQQDLWFVADTLESSGTAAGCCSTRTRSPRTAPPRSPATTPARTAAGWPSWSATAAATGAASGCSTSPAATRSTTSSAR